ncbi:hypothetical protein COL95_24335 [Bacillus anthracis]|nr:hypothetical protein COL95_24335 [Bacillus anthracis]
MLAALFCTNNFHYKSAYIILRMPYFFKSINSLRERALFEGAFSYELFQQNEIFIKMELVFSQYKES